MRRFRLLLLTILAVAALASPAAASTSAGYSAPGGNEQAQVQSGRDASSSSGRTLPFTGLDVGLMLVGGSVLLIGGVVLARQLGHRAE